MSCCHCQPTRAHKTKTTSISIYTHIIDAYISSSFFCNYFFFFLTIFLLLLITSYKICIEALLLLSLLSSSSEIDLKSRIMSLINCLRKIDSEEDAGEDKKRPNFKMSLSRVERSWSGNLAPNLRPNRNFQRTRSRSNLRPTKKSKNVGPPGASYDSAPPTPRLVRSSGMRRDWSFEDLRRAIEG